MCAAAFAVTAAVAGIGALFACGRGENPDRVLESAEIFDPATGTFTASKNGLSGPRMEHLGVSLSPTTPR